MKIVLISLFICTYGNFSHDVMKITLLREVKSESCILGTMYIDDNELCKTLELPDKNNENDISAIPVGIYKGILRYDHADQWRIELLDVPNRANIQIHIGNYPSDSKGCILVGKSYVANNCSLSTSTSAYLDLKEAFYGSDFPIATPNKEIEVTIEDK